jgi:hypothetical protein
MKEWVQESEHSLNLTIQYIFKCKIKSSLILNNNNIMNTGIEL